MPIEGVDYYVRIVDLPIGIGGMVTPNEDGTYSVYINARLSRQQNINSLEHERNHMAHDDFSRDLPVETLETEAG